MFRFGLLDWIGAISVCLLLNGLFDLIFFRDVEPSFGKSVMIFIPTTLIIVWIIDWLRRVSRACDQIERVLEKIENDDHRSENSESRS